MRATPASSAISEVTGAPRSAASLRPVSSHRAALVSSISPALLQATSTSLIAVSRLKMNCCDCSSWAFFSSSATSSATSWE